MTAVVVACTVVLTMLVLRRCRPRAARLSELTAASHRDEAVRGAPPVSYTHLTLPTNREV